MSQSSPILALPYIQPAQAQKHVTHNEALRLLDAVTQLSVLTAPLETPPPLPAEGDRYLVAPAATDDWAGQDHAIAVRVDAAWQFFAPREGWRADVATTGEVLRFDGAAWVSPAPAAIDTQNLAQVGVNASADNTNRLSVSSAATLLSHAGSDHQLKVNKAAATDTASLLFQTGFSGRAEMGTTGSDAFAVKVSADGTTFHHGVSFDPATGNASFGDGTGTRVLSVQSFDTPAIEAVNTGGVGGATFRMRDTANAGDWKFKLTGSGGFKLRDETAGLDVLVIDTATHTAEFAGPVRLPSVTVAGLPGAAAVGAGAQVYVSDASGGPVPAFSDGTDWRRVTDRSVIS